MFSMSEVVLLAKIKDQERLSEAKVLRGVPVPPRTAYRVRAAQALRALAARFDPSQGDAASVGARLSPAE